MPSFATAQFTVELQPTVTREQLAKIMMDTVGDRIALCEGVDVLGSEGLASFDDGTLDLYISSQVSWNFHENFHALCEALAPLAQHPFESSYDSEDHGGESITYWGPDPVEVRNYAYRSDLAVMSIAGTKIIREHALALSGPDAQHIGRNDRATGVTFALDGGQGGDIEPVVSVCLAYVNDEGLRQSIATQAHLLATLIAKAKGEQVTGLVSSEERLMPAQMPAPQDLALTHPAKAPDVDDWIKQVALELVKAGYSVSDVQMLLDKTEAEILAKFNEGASPAAAAAAMPEIESMADQRSSRPRGN